ncbi:hypothetical protein [Bailinhaonella thermotolerans]|uniref:Uncharacterized protein n=1 Tax=Bailinhaonella thermotolerans TaxID=1070861 RepID=A0A3A4BM45_9ACTN|nr:hypothetical protein [Bailinhaonella thermotolerans]RJL32102.1 hypothetical protein D5H75_16930 [Bailinhaonella thermotolerans]
MNHEAESEADQGGADYVRVVGALCAEFSEVHPRPTVVRCVNAARHGAIEVTGGATPDLVERIARKHLQVLALVATERG